MHDDPILDELRALPRERPRAGFAERVLSRLDEAPRSASPFVPAWPRWVAATVALCALAGWLVYRADEARERRAQLAALRAESETLAAELAALRAAVEPENGEVIYLGGDEATDFVVDLSRLARGRDGNNLQPAALRSGY